MFKINSSKKLQIWTIIAHALIVVGFGHGIANFAVIEAAWLPYVTNHTLSFDLTASFDAHLPTVGLTTLIGQILLVLSIFQKAFYQRISLQISGLVALWLSIFYFLQGIGHELNIHFAGFTALPFAICTVITFFSYNVKRAYDRIIDL